MRHQMTEMTEVLYFDTSRSATVLVVHVARVHYDGSSEYVQHKYLAETLNHPKLMIW